jgi:hypothetical protein
MMRPPWRTVVVGLALLAGLFAAYVFWSPGLIVRDGRHDRGRNGIWLAHGWLGADEWFVRNGKTNQFARYRDQANVRELAAKLRTHHVTDVFPHLCPADSQGGIPAIDARQVELFLDEFGGFRVLPWIGGPNGSQVRCNDARWRIRFINSARDLLAAHPRLAGVHLNIEPLTTGDVDFLTLLDELRASLPKEKLISVAAYPPPTHWHPYEDVHWNEGYFRQVARRVDQLAVMMYDTALRAQKPYRRLMADWTREILNWSEGKEVLLGVPTYDDAGVGYHNPEVENITNALLGIHRGLSRNSLPTNYQGVAIYCDWETDDVEWRYFRENFLKQ